MGSTSVVVVSWRPGDWLARCLASASAQADQVILVDNGSEGAEASRAGEAAGAEVLRLPANRGFAPAANLGARRARGQLLAFLNDDAVAGEGWLSRAEKLLSDNCVAAVGPKVTLSGLYREIVLPDEEWRAPGDERPLGRRIFSVRLGNNELLERAAGPGLHRLEVDPTTGERWRWSAGRRPWYVPVASEEGTDGLLVNGEPVDVGPVVRLINSAGSYLDERGYAGDIGAYAPDDGRLDQQGERFAVSGTAFAVRTETWRRLGQFAGPFFAYYEDVDWCWRAQLAGMRVLYDPVATVQHQRSATSGGEHQGWVRIMAERNRTLTTVRNGPRRLAVRALAERARSGPDGGVRADVARKLPWALATRAALARQRVLSPEEVWAKWAGWSVEWPDGPAARTDGAT